VNVVAVGADRDDQRISLSIEHTGAERYVNELETGQTVDPGLTHAMPYGPFACPAEGVEGLILRAGSWRSNGVAGAVAILSPRREHMKRCPEGGRAGFRTYNRNQMMPEPIYGPEEL
jgi:hypothetical protein